MTYNAQVQFQYYDQLFKQAMPYLSAEQLTCLSSEKLQPLFNNAYAQNAAISGAGNVGIATAFMNIIYQAVYSYINGPSILPSIKPITSNASNASILEESGIAVSVDDMYNNMASDLEILQTAINNIPGQLNYESIINEFMSIGAFAEEGGVLSINSDVPSDYISLVADLLGFVFQTAQSNLSGSLNQIYTYANDPDGTVGGGKHINGMSQNVDDLIKAPILQFCYINFAGPVGVMSGLVNSWLTQTMTATASSAVGEILSSQSQFMMNITTDAPIGTFAKTNESMFETLVNGLSTITTDAGSECAGVAEHDVVSSIVDSLVDDLAIIAAI